MHMILLKDLLEHILSFKIDVDAFYVSLQHEFPGHIPWVQTVISQDRDKSVSDSLLLNRKVRYPIPKIDETGFPLIKIP